MKKFYLLAFFTSLLALIFLGRGFLSPVLAEGSIRSCNGVPTLPPLGSVEVIGSYLGAVSGGNLEREGASNTVRIALKDGSGNPYPSNYNCVQDGKPVYYYVNFELWGEKGDGQLIRLLHGFNGRDPLTLNIAAIHIRNHDEGDLLDNPLTPGPVVLKKIKAWLGPADTSNAPLDQAIQTVENNFSQKLFTVSDPPRIDSLSQTVPNRGQTVTISGANFDAEHAAIYSGGGLTNYVYLDLDRSSRVNSVEPRHFTRLFSGWAAEDLTHYCSANKIQIDIPAAEVKPPAGDPVLTRQLPLRLPTGHHKLIIGNDFGYSNEVDIEIKDGIAVPNKDADCDTTVSSVTDVSPSQGPPGTIVTISGTGLGMDYNANKLAKYGPVHQFNYVYFNGLLAEVVDFTATGSGRDAKITQLLAKVPAGATTGKITVLPGFKHTIVGPVFTVTSGTISPTPTTSGGGGENESLNIIGTFPDSINSSFTNYLLLKGTGFSANTKLTSSDSAIKLLEAESSTDGKDLRVKIYAGNISEQSFRIFASGDNGSDSVTINVEKRQAGAPNIDNATISVIDETGHAKLVITGDNLLGAQVKIEGIQAQITEINTTTKDIRADLEFSPFYSQADKNWFGYVLNSVLALDLNKGVVEVTNNNGSVTTKVDANKPANPPNNQTHNPLNLSFGLKNPLKGSPTDLAGLFGIVGTFIFNLGVPVAVIIIIYGGFLMLTSGGIPAKYKKGTDALKYAVIGLAIILIGKGFATLIQSILSVRQ